MIPLRDQNPTRRPAVVTVALIIVNIVVFAFLELSPTGDDQAALTYEQAAIPCEITEGRPLTVDEVPSFLGGRSADCQGDTNAPPWSPGKGVFTAIVVSMFLHAGLFHLLSNCWFLWIFGNNVEDHLGRWRYLVFYLVGGVAATVVHVLGNLQSTVPLVGASGAIAAVMGAYLVWFPSARIFSLLLIIPIRIRASWWLGIWFVSQFLFISDPEVAWLAHVGGFVFGVAVGLLIREIGPLRRWAWETEDDETDGGLWDNEHGGRTVTQIPPYQGPIA